MFLTNKKSLIHLDFYGFKTYSKLISYLNIFSEYVKYTFNQISTYSRSKLHVIKTYIKRYETINLNNYLNNNNIFNTLLTSIQLTTNTTKTHTHKYTKNLFFHLIYLNILYKLNIINIFNNKQYLTYIFKVLNTKAITIVNKNSFVDISKDISYLAHNCNKEILKELSIKKNLIYVHTYLNKNILNIIKYDLFKTIKKNNIRYIVYIINNIYNVNLYLYSFSVLYNFITTKHYNSKCNTYTNLYVKSINKNILYNFIKYFLTLNNASSTNNTIIYTFYNIINKFIFGQASLTKKITTHLLNFNYTNTVKPIGSFLLCGPSGTGKTEIVKLVTDYLYKSSTNLLQFDMSEYKESHSVAKLIGSPPGYVGHEEGGNLINKVNSVNSPVILFDEIEKADKHIFSIFLQILDEGILTDSKGNSCKFNKSLIFFTSNLGSKLFTSLNKNEQFSTKYYDKVRKDINANFKLEFINRLNDILIFNPLSSICLYNIFDKHIYNEGYNQNIMASTAVKSMLSYLSYSPARGSRFFVNNINKIINNLNLIKKNKLFTNTNNFIKYILLK
uniref:ATP-dependent Clp protease n=1 Tax=Babesia orientalis TaxID=273649 RepID=A0A0M4MTC8_9APIC|nr:ATP-dependent Clp protease [Babesia orientalis]ALE29348.1 ATP-dependent Clp protease [Babesia orientalis]